MSSSSDFLKPHSLLALLLGVISLAMGPSDTPTKLEPRPSGQRAATIQSAPASVGGDEGTNAYEISVQGASVWTDTGLELRRGDRVLLTAAGTVQFPLGQIVGPKGTDSASVEVSSAGLPVSDASHGALVARIGQQDTGVSLLVGAEKQIDVLSAGRLYLGVNEYQPGEVFGNFTVHLEIKKRGVNPASQSDEAVAALVPVQVLAKIPRRARDSHGQPEDLVNLLILGCEQDLKLTFEAAGWVSVSRTDASPAISRDALQRLSEQAYVVRALSELFLFGGPQDYSFADTELITVIQARHYLRAWKNQSDVNQQTLWVGAAAHDTGPWWNSRTGEVSYKVDPNVDAERDFVRDTLNATGLVEHLGYVRSFAAGRQVRTPAGSNLQTDGRVLVMTLVHLPDS